MFGTLSGQEYHNETLLPEKWEMELTDYFDETFSQILKLGKPTNWPVYTLNTHRQLAIRNNDSAVIINEEDGAKLVRSQYAIDNFILISTPPTTSPSSSISLFNGTTLFLIFIYQTY